MLIVAVLGGALGGVAMSSVLGAPTGMAASGRLLLIVLDVLPLAGRLWADYSPSSSSSFSSNLSMILARSITRFFAAGDRFLV